MYSNYLKWTWSITIHNKPVELPSGGLIWKLELQMKGWAMMFSTILMRPGSAKEIRIWKMPTAGDVIEP